MIVRDAHQSGFHGVTQDQWTTMLTSLAGRANVGVATESVGFEPIDGWDYRGHETKVVWDASRWEHGANGVESIPTPAWKRGTGTRTSVEVEWALLRNIRTGLLLLRGGGHLPAHLFRSAQLAANKAALDGLAGVLQGVQGKHPADVCTLSFDFNRALERASQRRIIQQAVAGTSLDLVVPPSSTLRLRTIDGFLTTGDLPVAGMLDRCKGFDHRGTTLASCGCPTP